MLDSLVRVSRRDVEKHFVRGRSRLSQPSLSLSHGGKNATLPKSRSPFAARIGPLSRATTPPCLGHTPSPPPQAHGALGAAPHCFTPDQLQPFQEIGSTSGRERECPIG